jgi:hypothetical protein
MTLLTNDDFGKRELSFDELEAIAAGVAIMGGVPNSITAGFPREPHLPPHFPHPRYWAGGSPNALGLAGF